MAVLSATPGNIGGKVKRRNAEAKRVSARALGRAAHRGRAVMVRQTPVDQGQLKNSWKARRSLGTGIGAGNIAATLTNDAPHAGIIESGARPHPVSNEGIAALHAWVWRHRASFNLVTASGRPASGKAAKKAALGIAYAIAAKIQREGQKPTYFVKKSMPQMHNIAIQEVAKALEKLANRKVRGGNKGGK